MADEQAQAEQTAVEETQEQAPAGQEESSTEQSEPESNGKGDLSVALKQEREARQALEARLSDPSFIYQQARQLGLTEEEAQAQAEAAPAQPMQNAPQADPYAQYKYFQALDKARETYPQLAGDEDDQLAVTALMQAKGLDPMQAAERYYSKMGKVAEAAKIEGAKAKEAAIDGKEQATAVSSTVNTTSEASEYEALVARTRNQTNPKDAQKAHLELIKWKEINRTK